MFNMHIKKEKNTMEQKDWPKEWPRDRGGVKERMAKRETNYKLIV